MTTPIKKSFNVLKADLAMGSKSNGMTLEFNDRTNPAPIEAKASKSFSFLEIILSINYILNRALKNIEFYSTESNDKIKFRNITLKKK